jgi:hypothetical protein
MEQEVLICNAMVRKPMASNPQMDAATWRTRFSTPPYLVRGALGLLFLCMSGPALAQGTQDKGKPALEQTATVEIEQFQVALLYSGNRGGGRLTFNGKPYDFTVSGLGIGGIGVSKIEATGRVYNLKRIENFPGSYVQARWGYAAGEKSDGTLWLQNADGVVLELAANRTGMALSIGADAIYFAFK